MKEIDKIELRSEKVRNIIGKIPPMIIRVGISVIFFIIIGLLAGSYFFKFDYIIETTAQISQNDSITTVILKIPVNNKSRIKANQKVILIFENIPNIYNYQITTKIPTDNKLTITKSKAFYKSKIEIPNNEINVRILEKIEVKAKIITEKINIYEQFVGNETTNTHKHIGKSHCPTLQSKTYQRACLPSHHCIYKTIDKY